MTISDDKSKTNITPSNRTLRDNLEQQNLGDLEASDNSTSHDADQTIVMTTLGDKSVEGISPLPGTSSQPIQQTKDEQVSGEKDTATGTTTKSRSDWSAPQKWASLPDEHFGVGTIIKDRFELIEMIGEGGMGIVFKALDRRKVEASDRNPYLAIKILNQDFKQHAESLKALQREARKAQDLAHPNIVTVFDFDREGSTVYMTMEYMVGKSLKQIIRENPAGLPIKETLHIIEGMCRGLAYAHTKGIIHSDFKPGNIILTEKNTVKVFDFGIARAAKTKETNLKGEETLFDAANLGALTPAFASPEMFLGEEPDPRDDIYALACIAYGLFCGQHPFNKERADHAKQKRLTPKRLKTFTRRQWKGMLQGLAFERELRTPSTEKFLNELRLHKSWLPIIIGGSAIGLAIIGVSGYPKYKESSYVNKIAAALNSQDSQQIVSSIQYLDQLTDERLLILTTRFRDPFLTYFEGEVRKVFDPEKGKYEYNTAQNILQEANRWYDKKQDVRLKDFTEKIEDQKNKLLSNLDKKYTEYLAEGLVFPDNDKEDVFDIISIIGIVSPNHHLLSDPRLKDAFIRETKKVLAENNIETADKFVKKGLFLFPDNIDIINIRDRVAAIHQQERTNTEIAELEAIIKTQLAGLTSLEQLNDLNNDLNALRNIQKDNYQIRQAQDLVANLFNKEITAAISRHNWQQGENAILATKSILEHQQLKSGSSKFHKAKEQFDQHIEKLLDDFNGAISKRHLAGSDTDNALFYLGKLEKTIPDDIRIRQGYIKIAKVYLSMAREARDNFDWDKAREFIDRAIQQKIDEPMRLSLNSEKEEIDLAQKLNTKELLVKKEESVRTARDSLRLKQEQKEIAKQKHISSLHEHFEQTLALLHTNEKGAEEAINILNQLETLNPSDTLIPEGRNRIIDLFVKNSGALSIAGDFNQAIITLEQGLQVISDSEKLASALESTKKSHALDQNKKEHERIAKLRFELDFIIAEADMTPTGESLMLDKYRNISPLLPLDDSWLVQSKKKIALKYIEDAQVKRDEKRFSEAYVLLYKANRFDEGNQKIKSERQAVAGTEKEYMARTAKLAQLANIEGLKQTLKTQSQANEVDKANQTLTELKNKLGAEDPFIISTAPQKISDAYLRLAEKKAQKGDLEGSILLANSGLKINKANKQIMKKLEEYGKRLKESKK